jgi:hypothetical protein
VRPNGATVDETAKKSPWPPRHSRQPRRRTTTNRPVVVVALDVLRRRGGHSGGRARAKFQNSRRRRASDSLEKTGLRRPSARAKQGTFAPRKWDPPEMRAKIKIHPRGFARELDCGRRLRRRFRVPPQNVAEWRNVIAAKDRSHRLFGQCHPRAPRPPLEQNCRDAIGTRFTLVRYGRTATRTALLSTMV